jgi:predicted  nucleic acid-binding Zn-ribbon protein
MTEPVRIPFRYRSGIMPAMSMATEEKTQLETELDALRKRTAMLEAQVNDLSKSLAIQAQDFDEHLTATYQHIADIHDLLMPVMSKVFPGFAETRKQIRAFVRGREGKKDS